VNTIGAKIIGYSGTPLPKKLGIKAGYKIAVVNAPQTFVKLLGALPGKAVLQTGLLGKVLFEVIVVFVTSRDELRRQMNLARPRMTPTARLWIAWPKRPASLPECRRFSAVVGEPTAVRGP
jgi:hypothetical protein